jgi:hypothetical protein
MWSYITPQLSPTRKSLNGNGMKIVLGGASYHRDRSAFKPPQTSHFMNKRPLTVASLNVRGLGKNSSKQKEIRS